MDLIRGKRMRDPDLVSRLKATLPRWYRTLPEPYGTRQ